MQDRTDRTLATIDEALTDWHSSTDAARWSPPPIDRWEDCVKPALVRRVCANGALDEQTAAERLEDIQRRGGESPYIGMMLPLAADLLGEQAFKAIAAVNRLPADSEEYREGVATLGQTLAPYVAQAISA